ncbi:MAG: alpha-L-fucosidase, partial [Clostridia bacterium]|nr:alpha-L-fucosidase [Clostridia bacterium]
MNDKNLQVPEAAQYIKDFEQLGFGMFVHYGLYSMLNRGEWALYIHKLDRDEYRKLQEKFAPVPETIAELVRIAKGAGCRYICLTPRHHEGFSLYDTCGLNEYDAPHSPAGRDLIAEFVDECRKADIVPFFYHTTLDWMHPLYRQDFNKYLDYLYDSVEILCTKYGKIGGLWFDGNWAKRDADWKESRLYAMIRRNQPEAIIINHTGT